MNEGTLLGVLDVTATLLGSLRLAAGIGAALAGWFATGPVVRVLYRGAFHRPAPGWFMPWTRLGGAALLGFLVYYYFLYPRVESGFPTRQQAKEYGSWFVKVPNSLRRREPVP